MQILDDDGTIIQYDKNTVHKVTSQLFSKEELEERLPIHFK